MNKATLAGELSHEESIARMIRVNHAGEYGAKRIYAGQLAVLKNKPSASVIQHMAEQEEEHLRVFSEMLVERRIRPTVLAPIWHVGGWLMGAATAMMGEKAAMACTAAVESVIDEHYAAQEIELGGNEKALKETVAKFRADEKEHHDTAIDHGAEQTPFYGLLTDAIKAQTRLAIWLSTRI